MRQGAVSLTDPAHTHGGPCRRVLHLAPRPRAHTVLRFVMNIAGPPLVLPSPALLEKCPWKCRASTSITIVETTMFMSEWWWVSLTGHRMVWSCSSSCLSRASTSERGHSSPTPFAVVPGGTAGPSQDDSDLDGGPFPFVVRVRSRRQCTSQRRSVYVSVEKTITHNRGVRVRLLNISRLNISTTQLRTYQLTPPQVFE